MNRKELESLGVSDGELIEKIIVLHGQDIEKLKASNSNLTIELETAKNQLTEANQAIEGFKALDVDGIKKAADDWKTKYEQTAQEAEAKVKQLKIDHAVDTVLMQAKARNTKAVRALLEFDKLEVDEKGEIPGLSEQVEKIKSEQDFLFDTDQTVPKVIAGGTGSPLPDSVVNAARKAAGLREN